MGILDVVCGQHGQSPLRAPGRNLQNLGRHGFRFRALGRLRDYALEFAQQLAFEFGDQRHQSNPTIAAQVFRQPTDAQPLEQVMSELQQFMALDPAAQDKLMADLKQVDPGLQPAALQNIPGRSRL